MVFSVLLHHLQYNYASNIPNLLPSSEERESDLGLFVYFSVCLSLSVTACRIDTNVFFFITVATPHVESVNDNYDVIGHIVWQPCWKKGKTLDLCISETAPRKKIESWHMASTPHGEWMMFFFNVCHKCLHYDVIIAYVECNTWSVWTFLRVIWG